MMKRNNSGLIATLVAAATLAVGCAGNMHQRPSIQYQGWKVEGGAVSKLKRLGQIYTCQGNAGTLNHDAGFTAALNRADADMNGEVTSKEAWELYKDDFFSEEGRKARSRIVYLPSGDFVCGEEPVKE